MDNLLSKQQVAAMDKLFITLQHKVHGGYPKIEARNIEETHLMWQLFFGSRVYMDIKNEAGEITISNIAIMPNSGYHGPKTLQGIEEYTGFTLKQLVEGIQEIGFHCEYDEKATDDDAKRD